MPAPYPIENPQLETALLVTLREALRWEAALAPVTSAGTYSGTLTPPATEGRFQAAEFGRRDRELAWLDLRNAAAVVEVALEVADVWHAAPPRPLLPGPQIGHLTWSAQDTSATGLTGKVVHVQHASLPVVALATDRDLAGRDTLIYETLRRAAELAFAVPPLTASGATVAGVTAWSLAAGTGSQRAISPALPLNRDLFRDPDASLAERDNLMAGYVARLCQALKNPFAHASRLYLGVVGADARELETYLLTPDLFSPGRKYADGDEIVRDGTVYRVRTGVGLTDSVPWTSPEQWEVVVARKRVWTCEPALPGRNRIVYNIETQELQWFRERSDQLHVPQIVALAIPGILPGQTIALHASVPGRKDGQFWRQKAALIQPSGGQLTAVATLPEQAGQATSGFVVQKSGRSLTIPATGSVHFPDPATGTYPQTLTAGFYRVAALVEPNAVVEIQGAQNVQAFSGTLSGADYPGWHKLSWQVGLPPGQWSLVIDYTNLAGSTDGFQVVADLDGGVIFNETVPLYFQDADGNPLPNGTVVTSAPFLVQPSGSLQVFGLSWTGGGGAFHVRELRFESVEAVLGRYRVSGTLAGARAVVDVVGENRVPGVMAWDFQVGTTAPNDFSLTWEQDSQLPLRILKLDVARFGTHAATPSTQGYEAYRADCLARAVRSAQQSFACSITAAADATYVFTEPGAAWDALATDRWMATMEQAEPRLRVKAGIKTGFICPERRYVVAAGSLVYEGRGYAAGASFNGHHDAVYAWATPGTLQQDGAWQPSCAGHLGRPALAPAGVYFDYAAGRMQVSLAASATAPEMVTLQPWMIKAGFYTAQSDFWVEPAPLKSSVLAPPVAAVYYSVSVSWTPAGGGTATGGGAYLAGSPATLTAVPELTPVAGAKLVDVVFVVDESGSMAGEHAWLGSMPGQLEAAFNAAGIGNDPTRPNRYGMVGYASSAHEAQQRAHKHLLAGNDFGSAAEAQAAAASLAVVGNLEDGYDGITLALQAYAFRPGAVVAVILITDAARTVVNGAVNKTSVEGLLTGRQVVFAAICNLDIRDTLAAVCIGRKGAVAYKQSGASYVTSTFSSIAPGPGGAPDNATVVADYTSMAEDVGGTTWDLNILRAGGSAALAFTAAFIDISKNLIVSSSVFAFDHWVVNGVQFYTNPYLVTVDGPVTAQAVFV